MFMQVILSAPSDELRNLLWLMAMSIAGVTQSFSTHGRHARVRIVRVL